MAKRWGSDSRVFLVEVVCFVVAATPIVVLIVWQTSDPRAELVDRGRYLADVGACAACHTPSLTSARTAAQAEFRSDPDWYSHLDHDRAMSGGVPFIIRISKDVHGVVYSRNITPDPETGIGTWTNDELIHAIRTGTRPDGENLFLFAPHSFYKNLAYNDVAALAAYLRTLPPVKSDVPERDLPFDPPAADDPSALEDAPTGRTTERAEYLLDGLVGCAECHSHHDASGKLVEFAGGDPREPVIGVFRLGPDLPLTPFERGFAAFPYPGYAVLYGGNLTRYGKGGDREDTSAQELVDAMRKGVSTKRDAYGRPRPLGHVMLWQFYERMTDDDAFAIADYIKNLEYIPHPVKTGPVLFGDDWRLAFQQVYGELPSAADARAFGK